MQSALRDINFDLRASLAAAKAFKRALREYQMACTVGNWKAAELAQQWVLGALEAHLDSIAAVCMRAHQAEFSPRSKDP